MSQSHNLFFRIGKLDTHIEEVEYKSIIMDLFLQYCDIDIDPEKIKLVVNHEYGGFKSFSFITMDANADTDAIIQKMDNQVTPEGYELAVSVAQDKPRNEGGNHRSGGYNNNRGGNDRGGYNNNRSRY